MQMLGHDSALKFKNDNVGIRLDWRKSEMKKMGAVGQAPNHPTHLVLYQGQKPRPAPAGWQKSHVSAHVLNFT